MTSQPQRRRYFLLRAAITFAAMVAGNLRPQVGRAGTDPWTAADVVEAPTLADELAHANDRGRPTVLYVGFRTLFEGGHIAGASFHGTASTAQGLADLKKWAGALPRDTNLVIYCGCCPFDHCPNIRPAFVALHGMGFTHLRVLLLPANFASDWVGKSYPIENGI
jgi:thiosulfate/3-mercaptopyruvate sulfurtransferase